MSVLIWEGKLSRGSDGVMSLNSFTRAKRPGGTYRGRT